VPPPLLRLPPLASTTAVAAAVGVLPATAAVAVVFTVGASDDPVKDELATSGTANSLIVDNWSLSALVVPMQKSLARDGMKKTCKISLVYEGCRGTAKSMDGACPHTPAVKRDQLGSDTTVHVDTNTPAIEDEYCDSVQEEGSVGKDESEYDFELELGPSRTPYSSRIRRPIIPCGSDVRRIKEIAAYLFGVRGDQLPPNNAKLQLSNNIRRCTDCSGAWHKMEVDGQSTVGIGSLWQDVTLYMILDAGVGARLRQGLALPGRGLRRA
jgi:hypothetical protein